ncbi:hypothetical protein EV121DRAFT_267368 [Schizophyllum commune]
MPHLGRVRRREIGARAAAARHAYRDHQARPLEAPNLTSRLPLIPSDPPPALVANRRHGVSLRRASQAARAWGFSRRLARRLWVFVDSCGRTVTRRWWIRVRIPTRKDAANPSPALSPAIVSRPLLPLSVALVVVDDGEDDEDSRLPSTVYPTRSVETTPGLGLRYGVNGAVEGERGLASLGQDKNGRGWAMHRHVPPALVEAPSSLGFNLLPVADVDKVIAWGSRISRPAPQTQNDDAGLAVDQRGSGGREWECATGAKESTRRTLNMGEYETSTSDVNDHLRREDGHLRRQHEHERTATTRLSTDDAMYARGREVMYNKEGAGMSVGYASSGGVGVVG